MFTTDYLSLNKDGDVSWLIDVACLVMGWVEWMSFGEYLLHHVGMCLGLFRVSFFPCAFLSILCCVNGHHPLLAYSYFISFCRFLHFTICLFSCLQRVSLSLLFLLDSSFFLMHRFQIVLGVCLFLAPFFFFYQYGVITTWFFSSFGMSHISISFSISFLFTMCRSHFLFAV